MKVRLRNAALIYRSENFFRPATYILFPGSECDMVKSFAAQAKIVGSSATIVRSTTRQAKIKGVEFFSGASGKQSSLVNFKFSLYVLKVLV
jgi:hypothetical protein